MDDGFRVDPDRLAAAADALNTVADRLVGEIQQLQGQLSGYGEPWGGDEIGMLIGATYDAVTEYTFDTLDEVIEDLYGDVDGLYRMAGIYQRAEDSTTDDFDQLGGQLEV